MRSLGRARNRRGIQGRKKTMTTRIESTKGRQAGERDGGTSTLPVHSSASLRGTAPEKPVLHEGYFDDVAAVFRAHQHPIIFLDTAAMRWMGARVLVWGNMDLLVKDNQVDDIVADFLATGLFERVEQDMKFRLHDKFVSRIPRLRYVGNHYLLYESCLSLWSEAAYMLPISSMSDDLVEVRDVIALNPNLVEERFDPYAGQFSSLSSHTDKLKRGTKILRPLHGLSAKFKCPLYIPSLPRFIDALLDQHRRNKQALLVEEEEEAMVCSYNVQILVRYLDLEKPSQREKLLPTLAERNRADMEIFMNEFKRKPVFKVPAEFFARKYPHLVQGNQSS